MNLLMFGMSSYPGGVESYIRNVFLNEFFSEKMNITFVCYEDKLAYSDEINSLGYKIEFVPNLKRDPLGYRRAVSNIYKTQKIDAVYVNMLNSSNSVPIDLAYKYGVEKIILHSHCTSLQNKGLKYILHKLNKNKCDKKATVRLACSDDAARWLFNVEKNDVKIIPNAIDTEKYRYDGNARNTIREKYCISDDEILLGSVGRFGPEKNNIFMLQILKKAIDSGMNAKLMLVGDGALREEIEGFVKDNALEEKVVLTGTITDPYHIYSAFDIFLFPSLFEGFGIAALEAQSCGLKCFCSDRLSRSLNVTGAVEYLPISNGADIWYNAIKQNTSPLDRNAMNEAVAKSEFNIEIQKHYIAELIYG